MLNNKIMFISIVSAGNGLLAKDDAIHYVSLFSHSCMENMVV